MPARVALARIAALAAGVLTLAACAPGALSPAPSPTASSTATQTPEPTPDPERSLLVTTLAASNAIAVVDPDAAEPVVASIEVGAAPWGVAVDDAADRAFVATADGLAIVDLAASTRTALVPYEHQPDAVTYGEYRDGGLGIAVSPDGATVYVAVHRWPDPAWLEVFDVATGAFTGSVPVGIRPSTCSWTRTARGSRPSTTTPTASRSSTRRRCSRARSRSRRSATWASRAGRSRTTAS